MPLALVEVLSAQVGGMEEEARTILRTAIEVRQPVVGGKGLGSRIHEHFARIGGVKLELPERSSRPTSPWS